MARLGLRATAVKTKPPQQRIIGLTGGIGSGKSTVSRIFVDLGAHLVDTDAISKALTAPGGDAIEPIRQAFGPAMIDASGAMDRTQMRAKAFTDPMALATLEAILQWWSALQAQA